MINIPGIEYKLAEKPYYGRYPFKVIIRGVRRNWRMSSQDQRAYNEFYSSSRGMLRWANEHVALGWRVRRESDWSFFFIDQAECEKFALEFLPSVRFIAGPKNQHHKERMLESPKLLVRRSLFKQIYPYRVQIHNDALQGSLGDSLRSWIDGQSIGQDIDLNHALTNWYNQTNYDRWGNKTIYFLDESNSIMLKLLLGDHMKQIEKVITVDEFSKQETLN